MKYENESEIRELMCEIGRRVYQNGFVAANDGNFSVKLSDDKFLCTPAGVSKGFMTPNMLCIVDRTGKTIQSEGKFKPSSEIKMHLRIYKDRGDVGGVVHAHPPYATAFAIAGIPLTDPILPEAIISLGIVPIAEYGIPSTEEIPEKIAKYLNEYDAMLLENHGALTYSSDLMQAYYKMESLEYYAKLLFLTKQLGVSKILSKEKVKALYKIRRQLNLPGKHPANLWSLILDIQRENPFQSQWNCGLKGI